MRILISIALLLLAGCTNDVSLKNINYNPLLNDDNSKVWLVNRVVVDGMNIAPSMTYDKEVMIFYKSGNVNMIPLKLIGDKNPDRGYFIMSSKTQELTIDFKKEKWIMKAEYITEDSLYFTPTPESDVQFEIQIIPLPEF